MHYRSECSGDIQLEQWISTAPVSSLSYRNGTSGRDVRTTPRSPSPIQGCLKTLLRSQLPAKERPTVSLVCRRIITKRLLSQICMWFFVVVVFLF